jgi:hypothetical protein
MLSEVAHHFRHDKIIVDIFELQGYFNMTKYIYRSIGRHFPYMELEPGTYASSYLPLGEEIKKISALRKGQSDVFMRLLSIKNLKYI